VEFVPAITQCQELEGVPGAFSRELLLVRELHRGRTVARGAARALAGCGTGGRCRPAAPQLARHAR